MKPVLCPGNKKDFPPVDWASIGEKVPGHKNLFGMIDYFLCQSASNVEAEQGFSVLKETKTSKRAILGNKHLAIQMRVILSGVPLE